MKRGRFVPLASHAAGVYTSAAISKRGGRVEAMTGIINRLGIAGAALGIVIAAAGWVAMPTPAQARIFVGFGFGAPYPGYYGYPCCGYPYPYPYPPPVYYPPPPPAYYPPTSYGPPAAPPAEPAAPATRTAITYTSRPAFTNAAGQTCREFKSPHNTLGTACRGSDGQWRVQN
ncbi:MAG TPA: hypothetical protein VND87_16790 [Stellaceae bacterium]|nr:hypothetical protein [Stellaceae bacterium]